MKKKTTLLALTATLLLTMAGCGSQEEDVPQGQGIDSTKFSISSAEEKVPVNDNSIIQSQGQTNNISGTEFDKFITITMNGVPIKLGESTVEDLAIACGGDYSFDSDFNCYLITINGNLSIFAYTHDDSNPQSPLKMIKFNNVFVESYDLSFNGVSKETSKDEAIAILGESTSSESSTSKNHSWEWKDKDGISVAKYNMIWYNDVVSEITISGDKLVVKTPETSENTSDETEAINTSTVESNQ